MSGFFFPEKVEYKYNNIKSKWTIIKHNYSLPHFTQFKKSFFYRTSSVATSGYLHYFLSLVFLTFSIAPFRSKKICNFIKKSLQHRCFPVNIPFHQ